jgi:iron complex outermembrane receptor protein
MTTSAFFRRAPACRPLALALSLGFAAAPAAFAQAPVTPAAQVTQSVETTQAVPVIEISGARFASDPALQPIGATVITADEIRRSGAGDVNQAIRTIGGLYGRQSLDSSPDFALDMGGFGPNSSENMVILLDGVRMNENELSATVLSTIPIETVERIEILRGGASVLYGEGATGGVIQIFTRRPGGGSSARGSIRAEVGQFDQHDVRASYARSSGRLAFDLALQHQGSDNYRANSKYAQSAVSGGVQWQLGAGRVGVRLDLARQDSRLPGALTLAQFEANPRQSVKPEDFGSLDTDRVTAFVEQRFGAVDLAAELSHRRKTVNSHYVDDFGGGPTVTDLTYESEQTQFSPRLRHLATWGSLLNELVAGIDLTRWNRVTKSGFSLADASQDAKALYLRDELRWDPAHEGRFALGVRHEVFDKDYADPIAYVPVDEHSRQSQNAWEAQASFKPLPLVTLYARGGQSYRLANADENSFRSTNAVLEAQVSHDLEAGVSVGDSERRLSARAFRHNLHNEIFYDPTIFSNTNLAPTQREGFDLDAEARLARDWRLSGHFQHVKARFSEGPNAGREMVLVPSNVLSARLAWISGDGQSADLGVQWVDRQRYGDDFKNDCSAQIPAATTFDARYARKLGDWELALSGLNLGDKQYFSNAFGCRSGIYPANGRQIKLSLRYDF